MKTMEPKVEKTQKKKVAFGAAGLSLVIHLGLLILIGGVVVVEYAVPRSTMTGELSPVVSSEEAAVPEEAPDSMGEPETPDAPSEAMASSAPLSPVEVSVSSSDVITVSAPSSFQMAAATGGLGGTGTASSLGASGTGGKAGKPGKISNPFGGAERSGEASWEGIFYDLKQTKDAKPSGMDATKYLDVLADFFKRGWDRRLLEKYYQVKAPLYTSQIYMPLSSAGAAPKAFHVEQEVQPSQWVIFYQGSFQSPDNKSYRFAGYADDILVVRVNDKVVLDGSIITSRQNNKPTENMMVKVPGQEVIAAHKVGNGSLIYSNWMNFEAGKTNKIEILVGERPGGFFCAYLFVEEKGKSYTKDASGRPLLPIFKTIDAETPVSAGGNFEKEGPVFWVQ